MRRASCIVLTRPNRSTGPEAEVYLVKRSPELRFLGGFHAFAGGGIEEGIDTIAAKVLETSAWVSAALRELFEELGILVTEERHDPNSLVDARRSLLEDQSYWHTIIDTFTVTAKPFENIEIGHWITPPFSPVFFDAAYFVLELPENQGEPEIWTGELVDGAWWTVNDALEAHERGALSISYPVLETLRILGESAHLDQARTNLSLLLERAYHRPGGEMIAGLHMLPVKTFTLPPATHTNCYLIGEKDWACIDPATPIAEEQEKLCAYIEHTLKLRGGTLTQIWLTHQHKDHIGAVDCLRKRFGAKVFAHKETAKALEGQCPVDEHIEDGQVFELERHHERSPFRWRSLHTPGHTRGHLCFWDQDRGHLITGDLILGMGTVLIAPPEGDMSAYLESLQRMKSHAQGFLFPAHGPPVATAQRLIEHYIAHRLERERLIEATLETPQRVEDIVANVYSDTPKEVWHLAAKNVEAHLQRLCELGRAERNENLYIRRQ